MLKNVKVDPNRYGDGTFYDVYAHYTNASKEASQQKYDEAVELIDIAFHKSEKVKRRKGNRQLCYKHQNSNCFTSSMPFMHPLIMNGP